MALNQCFQPSYSAAEELNAYHETPAVGLSRPAKAVTLPTVDLDDIDIEREAKEVAERVSIRRIIRRGRDAWEGINKAENLDGWKVISAALHIGKLHALRITGANAPWGRNYSREFGLWMKQHGFDSMPKATRSWALALHENIRDIERWLSSLSERERKKLKNPQSFVRRWQRDTQQPAEPCRDAVAAASAAWRCFVARVKALPAEQAAPIWQAVLAEVAALAPA